uniref:Uncharacterized protein n=1 Tax=Rhinolophus ferrumequinum TaxID=59479 RepID=A0A671FD48_RHIFE
AGLGSRWSPAVTSWPLALNFRSGFLDFSTIDILGQIILCCGGCPVHCRMFGGIPGFYLLDESTPTVSSYCLDSCPLSGHLHLHIQF